MCIVKRLKTFGDISVVSLTLWVKYDNTEMYFAIVLTNFEGPVFNP